MHYETVYRNVPAKYKSKFNDKTKLKIVKFLDWNFKDYLLLTMPMSVELNLLIKDTVLSILQRCIR